MTNICMPIETMIEIQRSAMEAWQRGCTEEQILAVIDNVSPKQKNRSNRPMTATEVRRILDRASVA